MMLSGDRGGASVLAELGKNLAVVPPTDDRRTPRGP
jgi:hypothetical protein